MSKVVKLFKFVLLVVLLLAFSVSLSLGILRPVYGDHIVEFLSLTGFIDLVGEHYFNSIFSILSGIFITILISYFFRASKKIKLHRKHKKVKNRGSDSIVAKVPQPSKSGSTQDQHKLRF